MCTQIDQVRRPWLERLLPVFVFGLAVAIYLPSLDNTAVYDDVHLVERDRRVIEPGHLGEIWRTDYWPGQRPSYNYRPLTTSSFALAARLSLNQRAINLVLHGLCTVFVLLILRRLGFALLPAVCGTALFALHPLSSEALYLIVGRGELLAACFGLALLWAVLRGLPLWLVSLLYAAALFSKANAVILPALALMLHRFTQPQEPLRALGRFAVKLALYTIPPLVLLFVARAAVFGTLLTPPGYVDPLYNPLAELRPDLRVLNALWVQLRYLGALLWPFALSADYSCCQLPVSSSWFAPRTAAVVAFVVGLALLLTHERTRRRPEVLALAFVLLALLPVSNLLFVVGVMFGERLAYLPSCGLAMLAAALVARGGRALAPHGRARWLPVVLAVALAVAFGTTVLQRDADWQDERAFCQAAVRDAPRSALALGLRFLWHKKRGDVVASERDLRAALAIYPSYYNAWAALAELLAARPGEAAQLQAVAGYRRAAAIVARRPRDRRAAGFLLGKAALLEFKLGRCATAQQAVDDARRYVEPQHAMFRDLALWQRLCKP